MNELKSAMLLVKEILENNRKARNSDDELYAAVLEYYDSGDFMTAAFFRSRSELGIPKPETVRRTRQLVQRKYPHLAADSAVQAMRGVKRDEYIAFAREEGR